MTAKIQSILNRKHRQLILPTKNTATSILPLCLPRPTGSTNRINAIPGTRVRDKWDIPATSKYVLTTLGPVALFASVAGTCIQFLLRKLLVSYFNTASSGRRLLCDTKVAAITDGSMPKYEPKLKSSPPRLCPLTVLCLGVILPRNPVMSDIALGNAGEREYLYKISQLAVWCC